VHCINECTAEHPHPGPGDGDGVMYQACRAP
jgi:hypothetical protein